jgi:hypothetical protein
MASLLIREDPDLACFILSEVGYKHSCIAMIEALRERNLKTKRLIDRVIEHIDDSNDEIKQLINEL